MSLKDADQRSKAIDPTQSYIVQAPAGSGKTELLTQRFLKLLGLVNAPEQIVALTFTRKAANEMRERILTALERAANNECATSAHQVQTLAAANHALARSKALGWDILNQPGRLRIITIDALCQRLAHAIPLHDPHLSFPEISAAPDVHYLNAAKACLRFAIDNENFQAAITTLLEHVDNRQETLLALFVDCLAQRDQWIQLVLEARTQDQPQLEAAIAFIQHHELDRFKNTTTPLLWSELLTLATRVSNIENNPSSPRFLLQEGFSLDDLNAERAEGLAALLLTTQNTLRKAFDHHIGLKKGSCDDAMYYDIKNRSKILLATLSDTPEFTDALIRVKDLPAPNYDPEQWRVLQSLFTLLPLLIAHLTILFNEHNEVDFTAISQQALESLGDDENPTDLALYLDNAIQHLLVDEFQDTSLSQFQLISQLVNGWQQDEGRTLFVVGDPMQSIYRFRAAEVGLFIRAKTEGMGGVTLISLQLSCNFRSTETIVQWVNQQFQRIFPQTDDMESGAVSFNASTHTQPLQEHSHVSAQEFQSKDDEANAIIDIIQTEFDINPTDTIAILVRSRSQLTTLLSRLREENIPFQGVEIDLLARLPHLRDVWSLTQILLMPAHRLATLAFLRSPWCGLTLEDLHHIANVDKRQSILHALAHLDRIPLLSDEGRIRCTAIGNVLNDALSKRHQHSLVDWIINTLNALHRDKIMDPRAENDLEQYWLLIERFEQDGQLANLDAFYDQLKKLYSKQITPSRLQIMTIHKSKGLEFDCVILPGLSKKSPPMNKPLLRWLPLPSTKNDPLLLISPMKASHHERCRLYDYLGKLDAEKSAYESQRLLYVATTRAKKRLYLTDYQSNTGASSLRQLLHQDFDVMEGLNTELTPGVRPLPHLVHLPIETYQITPIQPPTYFPSASLPMGDATPRLIGVILHELLQWIGNHAIKQFNEVPLALIDRCVRSQGLTGDAFHNARQTIHHQLNQFFNCPIGQWIIAPHEHAQNEYQLLIEADNDIATRVIDRTFCDQGTRWIIDYKTGHADPKTTEQYRNQVNEYAKIIQNRFHSTPNEIRCGLYYLANNHWDEWAYLLDF